MKCYKCEKEFDKPKYGRSKSILILLFLFFIPGWILYLILKPAWICPYCGEKLVITDENKPTKTKGNVSAITVLVVIIGVIVLFGILGEFLS